MNIRWLPLAAALVPFVAVQLSYLVAASHGHVDWCNPYLDSCSSISATGRHAPASFIFRSLMLPSAVLMMAYWWFNHAWLQTLPAGAGATGTAMLWLGLLACLGLIAYVTVLGEVGRAYQTQRRIGTVLFFSFTYLSQLLLVARLRRAALPSDAARVSAWMLRACLLLLLLGLLTVLIDGWDEAVYDSVEDAFEWWLSLLLQVNFGLGYVLWRRCGLSAYMGSVLAQSAERVQHHPGRESETDQ